MAEYRSPDLTTATPIYNLPIKREYGSPIGDAANAIAQALPLLRKQPQETTLDPAYFEEASRLINETIAETEATAAGVAEARAQYEGIVQALDTGATLPPYAVGAPDMSESEKEARGQAAINIYSERIRDLLDAQSQRGVLNSTRAGALFRQMLSDPNVQTSPKVYQQAVNLWESLTSAIDKVGAKKVEDMPEVARFREDEKTRLDLGLSPAEYAAKINADSRRTLMESQAAYLTQRANNTKEQWQSVLLDQVDDLGYRALYTGFTDSQLGQVPSIMSAIESVRRGAAQPQSIALLIQTQRDAAIREIRESARAVERNEDGKNNPIKIDTTEYETIIKDRYDLMLRFAQAENFAGLREAARQDALIPFFESLAISAGFSTELPRDTLAAIGEAANLVTPFTKSVESWASGVASLQNITIQELAIAAEKGSRDPKTVALYNEIRRQFVSSGMPLPNWAEGKVPSEFVPGTPQFADVASKIAGMVNRTYVPTSGDLGWLHPFVQKTIGAMASSGAITPDQTANAISKLIGVQFDVNAPEALLINSNILNNNSSLYVGIIGDALRANPNYVREIRNNAEPKIGNMVQNLSDSVKESIVFDFNDPLGFSFRDKVVPGRLGPQGRPGQARTITAASLPDPQLITKLRGLHNLTMQILGPQEAITGSLKMAEGYGITILNIPQEPQTPAQQAVAQPPSTQAQPQPAQDGADEADFYARPR